MAKATKRSAGLLMYRTRDAHVQVLLVHPGGPFWASKDQGAWTIPKGEYEGEEEPLAAAIREFREETGFEPAPPFLRLGTVRQKSGKLVIAWAFRGDCDPRQLVSNRCTVQWPPRSGKFLDIPEIDEGRWFPIGMARRFIRSEQLQLLDSLGDMLLARSE
ncbi:MAG TPA: NUDIX domain-containing protein [Acidisarcina sp.]